MTSITTNMSKRDPSNAARERNRVRTLRNAFTQLQKTLPSIPPDTKLSKLDILILATAYIEQLSRELKNEENGKLTGNGSEYMVRLERCSSRVHGQTKYPNSVLHPVKKWPMRPVFSKDLIHHKNLYNTEQRRKESYKKATLPNYCFTECNQII